MSKERKEKKDKTEKVQSSNFRIVLKDVRLSYPALFRPQEFTDQKSGEVTRKYSASFIMEKSSEQHKLVKQTILKAMKEKWPKQEPKLMLKKLGKDRVCLKDGDLLATPDENYEGMMYVKATSSAAPVCRDRVRTRKITAEDNRLYAGCYVNAIITIFIMDSKDFGKRVCASLDGVQFVRDGASLGGRGAPVSDNDFDDLESDDEDDFNDDEDDFNDDDEDDLDDSDDSDDEDEDEDDI